MLVRVPGNLYKKKLRIISYSFLFESASHLLLAFQHNFDPPKKMRLEMMSLFYHVASFL